MGTKKALRELWKNHVVAWKISGKSCKQWAKDNNVPYNSLLYWRQKQSEQAPAFPKTFVEIRDQTPASSGIIIEIADAIVRVDPSFDAGTLSACIQLLRKL